MSLLQVVSREEWLVARRQAARAGEGAHPPARRIEHRAPAAPMVEIVKDYRFEGPSGEARLVDLSKAAAS